MYVSNQNTFVIMEDGTVWGCGNNSNHKLTIPNTDPRVTNTSWDDYVSQFIELEGLSNVVSVADSEYHTLFLNSSGEVYGTGRSNYCELGVKSEEGIMIPRKLTTTEVIVQIEVNEEMSVMVTDTGRVLGMGLNSFAWLSEDPLLDYKEIGVLTDLGVEGVKKIALTTKTILFLMENGTLKARGYNYYGEAGLAGSGSSTLVDIPGIVGVKDISGGLGHFVIVMQDGTVMASGKNEAGQLGLGDLIDRGVFEVIPGLSEIRKVFCSSSTTILTSIEGDIFVCGSNGTESVPIFDGLPYSIPIPTKITISDMTNVIIGPSHLIVLMNDGTIRTRGYNPVGQLGVGDNMERQVLTPISLPKNVAILYVVDLGTGNKKGILFIKTEKGWVEGTIDESKLLELIDAKRDAKVKIEKLDLSLEINNVLDKVGVVGTIDVDETDLKDNYLLRYDARKNKLVYVKDVLDRVPPGVVKLVTSQIIGRTVSLTWTNPVDVDFAGVKIVRSINGYPTSLEDGEIVYTGTSNSFIDVHPIFNTDVYYTVFPYDFDGNFNVSEGQGSTVNLVVIDDITNSPGPKALVSGDMAAGYFGIVPASELFTGTEISTETGIVTGVLQNTDSPWYKFAIDNKIIFKSSKSYRHSISWNNIDTLGCVNGTKRVTKLGVTYKVRLMGGSKTDPANGYTGSICHGSEWNKLLLPIHVDSTTKDWSYPDNVEAGIDAWGINLTNEDMGLDANEELFGFAHWCKEQAESASYKMYRGRTSVCRAYSEKPTDTSSKMGWSPVLEYESEE